MVVAIMQPYLFPYAGYYSLVHASERFVLYEGAQYRRGGLVNRNRLRSPPSAREPWWWFTLPLRRGKLTDAIADREVDADAYPRWRRKFFKRVAAVYDGAPQYAAASTLLARVLPEDAPQFVADVAAASITEVCAYLELAPRDRFRRSESVPYERGGDAERKVITMCSALGATTYVNAPGGKTLYSPDAFASRGIELRFLDAQPPPLTDYRPTLSILDALFYLTRQEANHVISSYRLAPA